MRLSASSINLYKECPRCFYQDKALKKPRFRGIFSSLPNGMDKVFKEEAEKKRMTGSVFIENEKGKHTLFKDSEVLKKWQHWASGLKWEDSEGNQMIGALDEVLVNEAGELVPADYKTKGSLSDKAYVTKYNLFQMDVYQLLLSTYAPTADYGIIFSYSPKVACGKVVEFEVQKFCLDIDKNRAKFAFEQALNCLKSDIAPPPSPNCKYCEYVEEISNLVLVK